MNEVFLDIETTGLNCYKDKIVEIYCMKIVDNITYDLHYYINPCYPISQESYKIHGLNQKFLNNYPLFTNIKEKLLDFLDNCVIITHGNLDIKIIKKEFKEHNIKFNNFKHINTVDIANQLYPMGKKSLNDLCKRYNIENKNREKHSAKVDVELLYNVYKEMKIRCINQNIII
jgi:DNA polymerase-3 subunit epsilon